MASLAGTPLSGEGQWRVLEKVHGEPAVLGTFLRDDDVETNRGATLGGGYYVWRSGLGVTRDGRVMSCEYYRADGHPSNPTPVALLPTQQQTVYRYYSPYSRDLSAVYAR